jgi:hypothetical protein
MEEKKEAAAVKAAANKDSKWGKKGSLWERKNGKMRV